MAETINRKVMETVIRHFHASFIMAVLMLLVFMAVEANENTAFIAWFVAKTGIRAAVLEGALIICAAAIVYFRTDPLTSIILGAPMLFLGAYLLWYGFETGAIPVTVMLYLLSGYVMTVLVMILADTLNETLSKLRALERSTTHVDQQ